MLRRTRTTKKLAKRIDLQYFTRPHALRTWRFWLSVAAPVLALSWFALQYAHGGQRVYSSGPMASVHAVFGKQCSLCHVTQGEVFFRHVTDRACLACHDAPAHQTNQAFTPQCDSCHLEHKGSLQLASTTQASCTQCHANLRTLNGAPHYARNINGFDRGHPQFAVLRSDQPDPANIRLNHYLHLQPGLAGPNNTRVQMICDDCHQTTASQETPHYAEAAISEASQNRDKRAQRYMLPSKFAQHCAVCHTLQFDRRFGAAQVPHDTPTVIHSFLIQKFSSYIATHPEAIREIEPLLNRQLPERARLPRITRTASEWTEFRVADAEWLLWTKTCKQCHALSAGSGSLPEIAKSNINARWLTRAQFDHHAHRMMTCESCHAKSALSHDTADILLPGIETCRKCHREAGPRAGAAEGRCSECHAYHNWSKAKVTQGPFTIPQLTGQVRLEIK